MTETRRLLSAANGGKEVIRRQSDGTFFIQQSVAERVIDRQVLELSATTARCERAEAEAARMRAALVKARKLTAEYAVSFDTGSVSLGAYESCSRIHKLINAALSTPRTEDVT